MHWFGSKVSKERFWVRLHKDTRWGGAIGMGKFSDERTDSHIPLVNVFALYNFIIQPFIL